MGVEVGMLFVNVGVLARAFKIFIPERDANMYTQHKRARIARYAGDSRGDMLYVLFSFFVCWSSAP